MDLDGFRCFSFKAQDGNILPRMRAPKNIIGERISAARKVAGLTQRQVAEMLGIPTRTFSYYESPKGDLPSSLLLSLADILGADARELLGDETAEPSRRGPRSIMEQRAEAVRELPRQEQQFVIKFLDQVLEDYGRRRRQRGRRAEN